MADMTPWQVLFVDDDAETCCQVKEYLEGEAVSVPGEMAQVTTVTNFGETLEQLATHRTDLLILDVRVGPHEGKHEPEAGVAVLRSVQERCFVPVVFYTALPNQVRDLETSFVRVVEKTEGLESLLRAAQSVFATGLPALNRALAHHVDEVQREYMWEFVAEHWSELSETRDRTALAYLLARRLAASLSGPRITELARALGDEIGGSVASGHVHPVQYYLIPPVAPSPLAGDIFQGQIHGQEGHWLLVTPSCDLEHAKADWVILCFCDLLQNQEECVNWIEKLPTPSGTVSTNLERLLGNSRQSKQPDRFRFLPGALGLPDLVVDFQQVVSVERGRLDDLQRVASLDSPFADATVAHFARYFGRLGPPDLDLSVVMQRLRSGATRDKGQ